MVNLSTDNIPRRDVVCHCLFVAGILISTFFAVNPTMPLFGKLIVALFIALAAACAQHPPRTEPQQWYRAETTKPYDDVLAELELAITEHNFRITGHNHIGSVIRQRGNRDFPDYDTLQFCNLTLAQQMLEMSPAAVAYMPCNIAVRSEHGKVVIVTHLLPTDGADQKLNDFFRELNGKLQKIVDFAVEK
jgi:uncharacterized protein (DUF302 family)